MEDDPNIMPETTGPESQKPSKTKRKPRNRTRRKSAADLNDVANLLEHPRAELKIVPKETPADAEARRRKDRWEFFLKEVPPHVLGIFVVLAAVIYCLVVLFSPKTYPEAQQRAWSLFKLILTGGVGYLFGKSAGKS